MNHSSPPSWGNFVLWLALVIVALELLADVLPRIFIPLTILGVAAIALRLVFSTTRRW